MDRSAVQAQIIKQQQDRFPDHGPDLSGLGTARFRFTPGRQRSYHSNIVGFLATTPANVHSVIKLIVDFYRPHTRELLWQINEDECRDLNLAAQLERFGFGLYEDLLAMVHEGPLTIESNPRVTVRRVITRSDMAQYELIASTVFGGYDTPPPHAELEAAAERRWQMLQSGWTRYYIGLLDQQPSGTVASTDEIIPLIQSVATLRPARQQGVATTMVTHAVNYTVSIGNSITSLYVNRNSEAERIYRRLGFEPLFTQQVYRITFDK